MDAAIASIMDPGELSPASGPYQNQLFLVTDSDDAKAKQEQLRAMYLAGFQAAMQNQHHHSLHEDFERAKHAPNNTLPVEAPGATCYTC
jgi:hypothetical protein